MSDHFAGWLEAAGAEVPRGPDGSVPFGIEISPLFALDAAELEGEAPRRDRGRRPPPPGHVARHPLRRGSATPAPVPYRGAVPRPTYSVVIPAYNAERTLGLVLDAVAAQETAPLETIVVDDGSTDRTAEVARARGARVVTPDHKGYAGGARNFGWDQASGDVVVFIDSDVVPNPGWGEGVTRAAEEFPGAIVGCARTFVADAPWQRVAHLQNETPWIVRGEPREARFVSSYCMVVPRSLELRFDESYGGEDHLFCVDAMAQGVRLIFDPRYSAAHHHGRGTFAALRRQHERLAYGRARIGPVQREGAHKRVLRACRCTTSRSSGCR